VACEGGWVCILVDGEVGSGIERRASQILLGDAEQFSDASLELGRAFMAFPPHYMSEGTAEYVEFAVVPFVNWLEKHKAFLQNRVVEVLDEAYLQTYR
jgi:hypothetical protein